LRDPHAPGSDAEIASTVKLQLRIRDDISAVSDMVNQLEWGRKQLDDVAKMLHGQKEKADLLKSVEAMSGKMLAVETKLVAREQLNSDDKYYVEAYKPYLNLIWLNGEVGTGAGDVAGGADFAPTDTTLAVLPVIEKDLSDAQADYRNMTEKDLPAFNRALAEHGIIPVAAATPSAANSGVAKP
jgi:hypothetical protein